MKVIFLDIDGVLNSVRYDAEKIDVNASIDETRLVLLKELVDKSGAFIVLSSTWRKHWDKEKGALDKTGEYMVGCFEKAGLSIYDKTADISYVKRSEEVKIWLDTHPDAEKFVIFDDEFFRWGEFYDYLVKTDSRIGRGLEKRHIEKALEILGNDN